MSYQAVKRHGGILNAHDWMKEANLERLQGIPWWSSG